MVHLEHFSDHPLDYITEFYTAEKVRIDSCPHCHSRRRLHLYGIYHRLVIWYEDALEITSPGMLLNGVSIEKMKEGYSKIRNRAISNAFSYMKIIEKWGSGIPRIIKECREYD